MKLYHQPRSRSTRIRWALEEIGAPYELEEITREFKQTPEYRAIHPLGRSPVLVLDGGPMFESAAMILQAADLHPEAGLIAPVGSHARAIQYQWAFFGMIELEGPASDIARQLWKSDGDPIDEVITKARARLATAIGLVVSSLDGGSFLVDDRFSVADLVVGAVLSFVRTAELDELPASVVGYVDALEARPARVKAYS